MARRLVPISFFYFLFTIITFTFSDQHTLSNEKELRFGKDESSTVILPHASCSKMHAKIKLVDKQPLLTDMNSTNGTFVNGTRVKPATHAPLKDHDTIRFGASTRAYMMMYIHV
jgi:smad nuclear-interacting protein 1